MTFIPYRPCLNPGHVALWKRLLQRVTFGFYLAPEPERCGRCEKCWAHYEALRWLAETDNELGDL